MRTRNIVNVVAAAFTAILLGAAAPASGVSVAVWLNGQTSSGGNAIPGRIDAIFGAGTSVLVTNAQLDTPGFLNAFDAVVVSRFDASFGNMLSAASAANVAAYVGAPGPTQGGVALFTNDAADNLAGSSSGDPFDANLDRLFQNAVTFAVASHHGYIGEFNGVVQAVASNSAGAPAMGLLPGNASAVGGYGPQFHYDVGPIGAGNPIDAGVTFPFTDNDVTTFLSRITNADPNNIVDVYSSNDNINGLPAVLANQFVINGGGGGNVPEPATVLLVGVALVGLALRRARS